MRGGNIFLLSAAFLSACGGLSQLPQSSYNAGGSGGAISQTASLGGMSFTGAFEAGLIQPACPGAATLGKARCMAFFVPPNEISQFAAARGVTAFRSAAKAASSPTPDPGVMTPTQLQGAYGIQSAASTSGSGRTVAVIEAGDDPNLEKDLAYFRSTFGLSACTTANGCFKKVSQTGTTTYPATDSTWAVESTIDTQTVSDICPKCSILVVEANSETIPDLAAAVNEAASLGAVAIANSYSTDESSSLLKYASNYSHSGVTITASSGDGVDLEPQMPADFSTVIAVGGTALTQASNARGWSEVAWDGEGGVGCSTLVAKPSWQSDSGCSMRTIADIAFSADVWSATNGNMVETYDSLAYPGQNGLPDWSPVVGTSFGAPAIAAMYALAGTYAQNASSFYVSSTGLIDITGGNDGAQNTNGSCEVPVSSGGSVGIDGSLRSVSSSNTLPSYYCAAQVGYDAPTGNGVPYGLNAFITVGATPEPAASSCPVVSYGTPNPHPTQNSIGNNGCEGS